MGLSSRQLVRSRDAPRSIPTGRQTHVGNGYSSTLSPHVSRTADVLKTLRRIPDEATAIEFLKKVNPDVSMAVWNFVRMANQGNEMQFYSLDKKTRLTDLESEWRDFAARINEISNSGLDGLIDQLHQSAYLLGAMGVEVEVTANRKDIYDVYPVKPQSIEWELLDINGRKTWVPYQYNMHEKVYLDKDHANFIWVPSDPDIGDPRGTLSMSPVLQAIDFQMQIFQDLQAVLHHQGYPKNDISIVLEKMMAICPPHTKNDATKLTEWLDTQYNNIVKNLENMPPDGDYVHFDDMSVNTNQGANVSRSLDVRAVSELVDIQTLSGTKQMAIFMNRNQGVTESWGSVQFKIFCAGITSSQRGSKRAVEEIARIWLRVRGKQANPVFKHNIVDYASEEQRLNTKLLEQKYHVIAVLMGWETNDEAAQNVMKAKKAIGKPSENIKANLSVGGDSIGNDKHSGAKLQPTSSNAEAD